MSPISEVQAFSAAVLSSELEIVKSFLTSESMHQRGSEFGSRVDSDAPSA